MMNKPMIKAVINDKAISVILTVPVNSFKTLFFIKSTNPISILLYFKFLQVANFEYASLFNDTVDNIIAIISGNISLYFTSKTR